MTRAKRSTVSSFATRLVPGSEIRLHQRAPSYVIEIGETTIAVDPEIAGEIFVKRIAGSSDEIGSMRLPANTELRRVYTELELATRHFRGSGS